MEQSQLEILKMVDSGRITPEKANELLIELFGNIRSDEIYQARFTDSIHESFKTTLSLHRTEKGAESVIEQHKEELRKEWEEDHEGVPKEEINFPYDYHKEWDVIKTKVQE